MPRSRRVARLGNGWHGFNLTPPQAAERVRRLHEILADANRDPADVEVTIGTYLLPVDLAAVEAYHEAGVDQIVVLDLAATVDDVLVALDRLAKEIVDPASRL